MTCQVYAFSIKGLENSFNFKSLSNLATLSVTALNVSINFITCSWASPVFSLNYLNFGLV
ncbi:hypothetical protein ES332_A10G136100v1 [Gossypium tomentosum]|uniref:Uncharacterized protein n=1 Tax=Gossypium tomentosum TaxID=34277 RepID=A0A5D2NR01_GOSTO|nr:hypothetical protein ES332_A10G136100v1 [Gossypium tomentosum]